MENNLKLQYIVYCTTNITNGKYYIGVHQTYTPWKFDGYLGNSAWIDKPSSYNKGKYPIHAAILKYGVHNFKRVTLKVFDNEADALDLERWLVTEEFIKQPSNYNAVVGGGMPPLLNKEVNQFDLEGNFIKTWKSETEIRDYFQSKVSMIEVIRNKRNFAGYFWAFDKTINVSEYQKVTKRGYIDQYDLNGNYITSFKSTNVASQQLDIDFKKLNTAIFRMKPCEGYYFIKSGIDPSSIFCKSLQPSVKKFPIYRYLPTGEFSKEYSSILKAQQDNYPATDCKLKNAVINGTTYLNYKWSFFKSDNYNNIENPRKIQKIPAIEQYDKQGNLIKIWEDYKECKKEFPYCLDVCRGKCKSTAGYVFKYQVKDIV